MTDTTAKNSYTEFKEEDAVTSLKLKKGSVAIHLFIVIFAIIGIVSGIMLTSHAGSERIIGVVVILASAVLCIVMVFELVDELKQYIERLIRFEINYRQKNH